MTRSIIARCPAVALLASADAVPAAHKWFRRNCNDVMGRECTTVEKADVLSWLLTLDP